MPYPVVGKEKAPDFLLDQFRLPGTQDHSRSALVRLELVEHKLSLPALVIRGGKLGGRDLLRVCDIGDQGYDFLAVSPVRDLVIDSPDVDSRQVGYLRQPVTEPV